MFRGQVSARVCCRTERALTVGPQSAGAGPGVLWPRWRRADRHRLASGTRCCRPTCSAVPSRSTVPGSAPVTTSTARPLSPARRHHPCCYSARPTKYIRLAASSCTTDLRFDRSKTRHETRYWWFESTSLQRRVMSEPQTVRAQDGREGTSKSDPGSLERRHLPGTVNLSGHGHRSARDQKVGGFNPKLGADNVRSAPARRYPTGPSSISTSPVSTTAASVPSNGR